MAKPYRDRKRTERRSWILFALVVLAFVVHGVLQRARERADVVDAGRAAEGAVANTLPTVPDSGAGERAGTS